MVHHQPPPLQAKNQACFAASNMVKIVNGGDFLGKGRLVFEVLL